MKMVVKNYVVPVSTDWAISIDKSNGKVTFYNRKYATHDGGKLNDGRAEFEIKIKKYHKIKNTNIPTRAIEKIIESFKDEGE